MNYFKPSILFLLLLLTNRGFSQSISGIEKSFTESTSTDQQFQMHLDTMQRYIHLNHKIVGESIEACHVLIEGGLNISEAQKVAFALAKAYHLHTENKPLEVFQLIEDHKHLLDNQELDPKVRGTFTYMEGYTLMLLGDHEFAQNRFYELLVGGQERGDTLSMLQSLYSLGQLYESQKDYKKAADHYLRCHDLKKASGIADKSQPLILLELIGVYLALKDYDQAQKYNEEGFALKILPEMKGAQADFYFTKCEIAIGQGDLASAQLAHQNGAALAKEVGTALVLTSADAQLASLQSALGNHVEALLIYERLLNREDLLAEERLEWYTLAHETCNKLEDYKKAYTYLLKEKALREEMLNDENKQQTAYLSTKFGAKEKEKENQILAVQILQQKTKNKLLYALVSVFLLFMVVLFGAFFQKRNYSNRLVEEVRIRTNELESSNNMLSKTNKELNEFNKILSHDLREPLRSILGFTTLLKRELPDHKKANEYLVFIQNSGLQLSKLIDDVTQFRQNGNSLLENPMEIDVQKVVTQVENTLKVLISTKNARIEYPELPFIYGYGSVVTICFKQIIENGIKYNQSESPLVQIRYHRYEGNHFFQFQDNGIGISQRFHEKIFGMFKRLNDRRFYDGSGLGLSIAQKMLEKVDGEIVVLTSEEGEGSIFQISFPVIQREVVVTKDGLVGEEVISV